jgi:hypothetical protein
MGSLSSTLRTSMLVVLVAGSLWQTAADAARFENLYTVTVSQDPAVPNAADVAMRSALARVLVRVTGSRGAPLEPALTPLLAAAGDYRSSSGWLRPGEFQVGFLGSRIEQTLRQLGMPVWGPERPLTLLWVAVDDGAGGRALLGAGGVADFGTPPAQSTVQLIEAVRAELAAVADERGLPIAWPLLDLEDLSAVSATDVWGGFEDRIVTASARYRADAVLIGRVRPGLFGNEVDWVFVYGTERRGLPLAGVRDGLDIAADRYAADLSTIGGASVTSLTIRDVLTPEDYGRVVSYLERQSVLENVDVEAYEHGTLRMRVAARGDARVLERVLALGGTLRPASAPGSSGSLEFEIVGDGAGR